MGVVPKKSYESRGGRRERTRDGSEKKVHDRDCKLRALKVRVRNKSQEESMAEDVLE